MENYVRDQFIKCGFKKGSSHPSRNLGVSPQMLGLWIKEEESEDGQAFRGNGKLTPERLEMEREILKKATVFFAKETNPIN